MSDTEVDIFTGGAPGTCQVRGSLDTPYDGDFPAYGALFTVSALTDRIDIQGIEFANMVAVSDTPNEDGEVEGIPVTIWARRGTTFSNNRNDWIELTSTLSIPSLNSIGSIAPRADMDRPIALNRGDEWLILLSLESENLRMKETRSQVGVVYQDDSFLQVKVGRSLGQGDPFSVSREANIAFQGKFHYRILNPCNSMTSETKFTFPFATSTTGTNQASLKASLSEGFNAILQNDANMNRLVKSFGLSLNDLSISSQGLSDDCSEYGFPGECELYDSDIVFDHFASLDSKALILDLLIKLSFEQGLLELNNDLEVQFIGDYEYQETFDMSLLGVPFGTFLNPIQREYLEDVILNFLEDASSAVPYRVRISQMARRKLRGRELRGNLNLEVVIYGVGDNQDEFLQGINTALNDENDLLRGEIQRHQYLPGAINDRNNLGTIFEKIVDVSIAPRRGGLNNQNESGSGEGMSTEDIQIISFSIGAAIGFIWLAYRICRDCILVERAHKVENKKLSKTTEQNSESSNDRAELGNIDKPRQQPTTKIDIAALPEIKPRKGSTNESVRSNRSAFSSASRKGRKPPTARGVRRAKSSDDVDLLGIYDTEKKREPVRGMPRAKSNDDDLFFSGKSPDPRRKPPARAKSSDLEHLRPTTPSASRSNQSRRGSKRVNENGTQSAHSRTLDKGPVTRRPPPASRGVKKSNTFSGDFPVNPMKTGEKSSKNGPGSKATKNAKVSKKSALVGKKPKTKKKKAKAKSVEGEVPSNAGGKKVGKNKKKSRRRSDTPKRIDMSGSVEMSLN